MFFMVSFCGNAGNLWVTWESLVPREMEFQGSLLFSLMLWNLFLSLAPRLEATATFCCGGRVKGCAPRDRVGGFEGILLVFCSK